MELCPLSVYCHKIVWLVQVAPNIELTNVIVVRRNRKRTRYLTISIYDFKNKNLNMIKISKKKFNKNGIIRILIVISRLI